MNNISIQGRVFHLGSCLHLILAPTSNLSSPLLPLDPAPQSHLFVPDKLPHDSHPALMARQIGVKVFRDLMYRRKSRPGNGREIVMLVVQAHVVRQDIQRSVVRVRFRDRYVGRRFPQRCFLRDRGAVEDVVLCDEVACARMQRASQKAGQNKVSQRSAAPGVDHGVVKCYLYHDVERVDARQGQLVDHHGAERVEKDLEGAEEGFACYRVEEERFEGGGEVGI